MSSEKKYCDRCLEESEELIKLDMYYTVEHWCQDCIDHSGDSEPNYDVITSDEAHARAWKQHRDLHS